MSKAFTKELLSGSFYVGLAKYSGLFISIIITAILSRMLLPEEFGIVAIATILINFFSIVTTVGFSPAIIQNKDLTSTDISCIYSFTVYLAIFSGIFFILISPLFSLCYQNKQLINICIILSLNIVFSVMNIVPNALLLKRKDFKFISIRSFFIQLFTGIISIIVAFSGGGIYSLLINPVVGSLLIYVVTMKRMPLTFLLKIQWSSINKVLYYSSFQVLFNIIYLIYRNIDKLLIGRYLGLVSLGYYEKSYRLMMLPLENVSNVISPVLHPILSEYQLEPMFIYNKYKKILELLAYIGFPLSVFCIYSAEEIILIVFGEKWLPAVEVFRILSFSIGIQITQSAIGAVFQSMNDTKGMFYAALYSLLIIGIGVVIGIGIGNVKYIAIFLVVGFYLSYIIYHCFLMRRFECKNKYYFISLLLYPLLYSIGFALLEIFVRKIFLCNNIYFSLLLNIVLLIGVYGVIFYKKKAIFGLMKK